MKPCTLIPLPSLLLLSGRFMRRRREDALAKRKDANMKAVVISERWDRKAAKYGTPAVPYPFDSRATYDRSLRQPLGRDFNTDEAFRCAMHSRSCQCLTLLLIARPRQSI